MNGFVRREDSNGGFAQREGDGGGRGRFAGSGSRDRSPRSDDPDDGHRRQQNNESGGFGGGFGGGKKDTDGLHAGGGGGNFNHRQTHDVRGGNDRPTYRGGFGGGGYERENHENHSGSRQRDDDRGGSRGFGGGSTRKRNDGGFGPRGGGNYDRDDERDQPRGFNNHEKFSGGGGFRGRRDDDNASFGSRRDERDGFGRRDNKESFGSGRSFGFGDRDRLDRDQSYSGGGGRGFGGDREERGEFGGRRGRDDDGPRLGNSFGGPTFGRRDPDFGFGRSRNDGGGFGGGFGRRDREESGGEGGYGGGRGFGNRDQDEGGTFARRDRGFGRRDDEGRGRRDVGFGNRGFGESRFGEGGYDAEVVDEMPERAPRGWAPTARSVKDLFEDDEKNVMHEEIKDREVVVTGSKDDRARIESWENAGFDPGMVKMLTKQCHYTRPRNIQAATMPQIISGSDVLGHAETGSGKTAAFALPVIDWIIKEKRRHSEKRRPSRPYAIVIAPTRELCMQLFEQCSKFASFTPDVKVAKCYGQYDVQQNLHDIALGCDILCACTGRLRHFMENGEVKADYLKFLILDECDRILRDNFKSDIDQIVAMKGFPDKNNRQTLMFSATVGDDVQQMARDLLRSDHAFVSLKGESGANAKVDQRFMKLRGIADKNDALFELLETEKKETGTNKKTLVFVKQKKRSDMLALYLSNQGIETRSINGDRPQNLREKAMQEFRYGNVNVLVGTDVCERGLDIRGLEHVIQYDMATSRDTYVHRIGRTGRVKRGTATTFVDPENPEERDFLPTLVKGVEQEVPDWLREAASDVGSLNARFGNMDFGRSNRDFNFTEIIEAAAATNFGATSNNGGFGVQNGTANTNDDDEW